MTPEMVVIPEEEAIGLCLNIGCGESPLPGFVNVDVEKGVTCDLVCDVRNEKLPYESGTVDQIWMIHCIEHTELKHWEKIFDEYIRCLKPNGILLLSYPEFSECAQRFVHNVGNQRAFWRKTLYGRQLYPSDYHVVPMDSRELKDMLESRGFYRVKFRGESDSTPYNTVMVAYKDPDPISRESVLTRELGLPEKVG
jgi:predicted SAM-dependent methyltransferase